MRLLIAVAVMALGAQRARAHVEARGVEALRAQADVLINNAFGPGALVRWSASP